MTPEQSDKEPRVEPMTFDVTIGGSNLPPASPGWTGPGPPDPVRESTTRAGDTGWKSIPTGVGTTLAGEDSAPGPAALRARSLTRYDVQLTRPGIVTGAEASGGASAVHWLQEDPASVDKA